MSKQCFQGLSCARTLLTSRLNTVRCLVPKVRTQDPDGIHDMRVASRRLRAALTECRDALPAAALKKVQKRARRITRELGRARELDVTLRRLHELRNDCPPSDLGTLDHLIRALQLERDGQDAAVARCVALSESAAFAHASDVLLNSATPRKSCYVDSVRQSLRTRMRDLRAQYREWQKSRQDDDLHAVRIAFKKLRYACEAHAPIYGKSFEEFVESIKKVQTALGDWNDFRIVREYARKYLTESDKGATLPSESIFSLLDQTIEALQNRLATDADDFFAKPSRERFRDMLRAPESPCCGGAHPKGEERH